MRILTALVIGLGVLIVAAAGLLAYGVFTRAKAPDAKTAPAGAGFGALDLGLPPGCAVKSVSTAGETVVIHVQGLAQGSAASGGGACDRVFVVHAATGRILGTINPAPFRP